MKEKTNNIETEECIVKTEKVELMCNMLAESIKPTLQTIELMKKTMESFNTPNKNMEVLNETMKSIGRRVEQFNHAYQGIIESIQPMLNVISNIKFPEIDIDFNEFKICFYRNVFKEKEVLINKLYDETIFPPISYVIKNNLEDSSIENWSEWILNDKDLKSFYIGKIDKWKDKYSDDDIKRMINEIKFNLEHNNSYSVCTLVAVLIEYMLKQNYSEKIKSKGGIYNSIRNVLKEKVFDLIDINELYVRFIEENLYASTDKAQEFSRHITHGDKIEFGNLKSAMNMIFIYDFLQDVMIINNIKMLASE